ncbi:MAG: hypothetical protein GQ475_02365 [Methylococcaceae bacterium]|nr:hypothetical protein [Methylococcaceae bacterium]
MVIDLKIVVSFISLLSIASSYCVADEINTSITPTYHWGRGLTIPSANLTLGGYVNVTYEHFESESDVAALDDLSLFISWSPHAQIRFFAELEMERLISTQGITDFSDSFSLERLYVDFLFTDSISIRFGQFLTPVGIWNIIHASPLVWTTSRPLVTESELFPSRTNGLMLTKQFIVNEHDLEFSLYVDYSDALDPRKLDGNEYNEHIDPEIAFKHAIGLYVNYEPIDSLKTGISYLAYKKRANISYSTNHLLGVDLLWEKESYEIQMEFTYRTADDQQGSEASGYLQGVAPLANNFFAIARYEIVKGKHQFESSIINGTTHVIVPALAWKPFIPLVIKAEYRLGTNNERLAPSGLFTSVSMLF